MNLEAYIKSFFTKRDGFAFLESVNNKVETLSDRLSIHVIALQILFAALCIAVALFGYRLVKVWAALGAAGIGYIVGVSFAHFLDEFIPGTFTNLLVNIIACVVSVVFLFLAFFGYKYVCAGAVAILCYTVTGFYTVNSNVAIGAAFLGLILAVFCFKPVVVVLTGLFGSVLLVNFFGEMIPAAKWLQLGEDNTAFFVAIIVFVVLTVVQFLTLPRKADEKEEESDAEDELDY